MVTKWDTHSHYLPPSYREACFEHGHAKPDGMPALPEWNVNDHLALMDKLSIEKSILSISTPGTHLVAGNNSLAAKVTRESNQYGADLKKRFPQRFGYFASLPIPEIDLCLREIDMASQEGCDGFIMLTNGHGTYPGDTVLDPVFDELNRRGAVLFFHPTTPLCPCSPENLAAGQQPMKATPFQGRYPNPMMEFLFDTARAVAHLFMTGTVKRCPRIRFVLPHCAGALPPLIARFTGFSTLVPGPWAGVTEEDVSEAFAKQFWFDLAGFPFPNQLKGLVGFGVGCDRLLYGSDYPFTKASGVETLLEQMDRGTKEMFTENEINDVYHGNAKKLLA